MNDKQLAILNAYIAWSRTSPERYRLRHENWERYVALRDGKEPPKPAVHKSLGNEETEFRVAEFGPSGRRIVQ